MDREGKKRDCIDEKNSTLLLSKDFESSTLKANSENVKTYWLNNHNCRSMKIPKGLKADRDNVLIYGKDENENLLPLQVNETGRIMTDGIDFNNLTQEAITTDEWKSLPSFDVSKFKTYTFAVVNFSLNEATVRVEISPNDCHYLIETLNQVIPPEGMIVLVPKYFLRYARLAVKSVCENHSVNLKIYLQAQG